MFYPDRNYQFFFAVHPSVDCRKRELARFRQWLPEGRVNQKREDALSHAATDSVSGSRKGLDQRQFPTRSSTPRYGNLRGGNLANFDSIQMAEPSIVTFESLLDELRLEGDRYKQHSLLALERFFAIREAHRVGMVVTERRREEAELAFRQERDLLDAASFEQMDE